VILKDFTSYNEPLINELKDVGSLWWIVNGRRVRGAAEARVLEAADKEGELATYVVKPAAVLYNSQSFVQKWIMGDSLSVRVADVGATMVDLAVHGGEQRIFLNQDIIKRTGELQHD
jgi:hypothetical protein